MGGWQGSEKGKRDGEGSDKLRGRIWENGLSGGRH